MILLDTDHLTVLRYRTYTGHDRLVGRLGAASDSRIAVTVISLEEQMRGWLAEIARRRKVEDHVPIYEELMRLVVFFQEWETVQFDSYAAAIYAHLKKQKIRIGTQDLKIASVALANDALLLSANLIDFQRVPGLKVEDWLYT